MFQFRRFPSYAYFVQRRILEYCSSGFPHSEISGSKPMCGSPKLIAACHVLLRLLMPRHSPCALFSLTSPRSTAAQSFWFSKNYAGLRSVHCSLCYPLLEKSTILLCFLSVACSQYLKSSLFSFQGARSDLLQGRIEMLSPLSTSIRSRGGGYRTRTGDPLLAKQVLYQLS